MMIYLVQGLGYGFSAAVQPGPFMTYILSQTLKRGWRRSIFLAFAPLVSDGPIILLGLFILSWIPDWFQRGLYIASGIFILYLALGAIKTWRDADLSSLGEETAQPRSVFQAALMNALSPGPYIYWSLVTGPILLRGWRENYANGISFLLGFYGAMICSLAGLILLFGTARQLGPKVNRALVGLSALTLVGFGIYQLWQGIFV